MKKMILVACLILAATCAQAQNEQGTFSLKPYAGLSSDKLSHMPNLPVSDEFSLKKDFLPGFEVGAEAEYQATDIIALSAGVNYSLQGGKWKDYRNGSIDINNIRLTLGYIQVPLMVNFYVVDGLALKVGVQAGLLIHSKFKGHVGYTLGGTTYSDDYNVDMMDQCNKFELSIPFGISYEFDNNLVLDARYKLGLTNIDKDDTDGRGSMKNRVFTISLGYRFDL